MAQERCLRLRGKVFTPFATGRQIFEKSRRWILRNDNIHVGEWQCGRGKWSVCGKSRSRPLGHRYVRTGSRASFGLPKIDRVRAFSPTSAWGPDPPQTPRQARLMLPPIGGPRQTQLDRRSCSTSLPLVARHDSGGRSGMLQRKSTGHCCTSSRQSRFSSRLVAPSRTFGLQYRYSPPFALPGLYGNFVL